MTASGEYCELCDMSLAYCPHGQPKPEPVPEPAPKPRVRAKPAAKPAARKPAKVAQPAVTTRAVPRRWTRPEDLEAAIVVVLTEAGGELPTDEALVALEALLGDRLTPGDRERAPTGELRWHLAARKARQQLINDGRMIKGKPGTWTLG